MEKTERVNVPVSKSEKRALKVEAMKAGYMNLSAYLRDKGLNKDKQED